MAQLFELRQLYPWMQALDELQQSGRHVLKIDLNAQSTAKGPETGLHETLEHTVFRKTLSAPGHWLASV